MLSDVDGKDAKVLREEGVNLVPSWLPHSKHIVWMTSLPGSDPTNGSQIQIMNTETGES